MAWGIFNKIGQGIAKGVDFIKNTALPVVSKLTEIAKPLVSGTKYGKYVDKVERVKVQTAKYANVGDQMVNAFKGVGGCKMMPQLKFEDLDDDDMGGDGDDEIEEDY